MSNNVRITDQVVKIQIKALQTAAIGVQTTNQDCIHFKAQFITQAQAFILALFLQHSEYCSIESADFILQIASENTMRIQREARENSRPERNDNLIAGVIAAPGDRNADNAPALGPPNARLSAVPQTNNPAVAGVGQLVPPRVVSGTGGRQRSRAGLVAVESGQQPPSVRPRTSDDLVAAFSEIQANDATNRSLIIV